MTDYHADPEVDVAIVGAGASGAVAARRLAEGGLTVTCLEQGDWHDRDEYRGAHPDWELTSRRQWTSDPNVRQAPGDYPADVAASDMGIGMFNGVGGGTVLYNGVWPRLTPADFRVASQDGVADDWPISYADLAPFYEATDRQFGVSGLEGNPVYPGGSSPPCPPLPIGHGGLLVARAHARLGWHWWPDTNAIASIRYDGRNPCVQRGTCAQGCGEGAKGSVDVTHWSAALDRGARLVTGATATRILTDPTGSASGVEWSDRDGRTHFQGARVVLLAANAVGTARLLLNSSSRLHPDGLANSSGLVGRRLMLHPMVRVSGWFDRPLESWQGHNGSAIGSWEFYRSDPGRGFIRGSKWSLHPMGGPLRTAFPPDAPPVWGPDHHPHFASRFGRSLVWVLLCEDLPEEHNRVELSERADTFGLPTPRIRYQTSENSRRMMAWQAERAVESLTEAGALGSEVIYCQANSHLLGTARMGDDPTNSVVDRWCMAHDVPNLGIIDGSVFVTAGAVNPTSTIAALALRAAERLLSCGPPSKRRPDRAGMASPDVRRPRRTSGVRPEAPRPGLTAEERRGFERLAAVLIPGSSDRPSPRALSVGDAPLDHVLTARPDLARALRRAIATGTTSVVGSADPESTLGPLDPEARSALQLAVAAAYYSVPEVRQRIGYPGQQARSITVHLIPEYIDEGLLDHVV